MQFIDLAAQQRRIRPQIDAAVRRVLDHGKYIMGPEVVELEALLADFIGVKHVIGCSSGTDALLLSLMAYDVGPGDAIFTTPFTFFATCEAIMLTGATPVFVDIDARTFNMNPASLESAIAKTKGRKSVHGSSLTPRGIMPVDLFGLPADYDPILSTASDHDLFVIEDAAQAFGAEYKGRKAPGLADIGTTSFFPAKPLGCYGDGGAVFTDDDRLADKIRSMVVHGKGADKYSNVRVGLNARLDTLQAAVLIEKLKIYPEEVEMRQALAQAYSDALSQSGAGFVLPFVPDGSSSVWAQFTVRCRRRDEVRSRLSQAEIPSMVYYSNPAHLLEATRVLGYSQGDFPVAEEASDTALSLPFYPYLGEEQLSEIMEPLRLLSN